jgi:anti-sigma factor RsiW
MDEKNQLQLQAYVDGELSTRESRRVETWLSQSPAARGLVEELRAARSALAGNEPVVPVPESREFYWSKIARRIEHLEQPAPVRPFLSPAWWLRYVAPVAAAAAIALMATFTARDYFTAHGDFEDFDGDFQQSSAVVFHSQSEAMTVVWLQRDQIN